MTEPSPPSLEPASRPQAGQSPAATDDLRRNADLAPPAPALPRRWRLAGLALLAIVLALSFLGYLSTDMQLQWDTIAAMCGF